VLLWDPDVLRQLLRWTFPHLISCTLPIQGPNWTSTEREDTLASFLMRHPALEIVEIESCGDPVEVWPSASTQIHLLNLRSIMCPARVIPSIFARGLQEARISWEAGIHELETNIVALAAMTGIDVPFACYSQYCDAYSYSTEIMDSISRNIPSTRTLHLEVSGYEVRYLGSWCVAWS
jgi:hypothetical protein